MEDETLTPEEIDALTGEQLLKLHLELARLEIRNANLMPGHLPKLPGVLQQKFEHRVLRENIEPLQNRPTRPSFSFEADLVRDAKRAAEKAAEKGLKGGLDVRLHMGALEDEDEAILERYEEECDMWHKDICLAALENAKEKITQTRNEILKEGDNSISAGNLHYYEALKGQIELFFANMGWGIPMGTSTKPKKSKPRRIDEYSHLQGHIKEVFPGLVEEILDKCILPIEQIFPQGVDPSSGEGEYLMNVFKDRLRKSPGFDRHRQRNMSLSGATNSEGVKCLTIASSDAPDKEKGLKGTRRLPGPGPEASSSDKMLDD